MAEILPYIQIVLGVLLTALILLQRSEAGLGGAFGGGDGGSIHNTRRGFEKLLFRTTILLAALFTLSAFVSLFVA